MLTHPRLARFANAENPTKIQRREHECNVLTRSSNLDDIKLRNDAVLHSKRERWHNEARDQIPPERVYMAVSDTPPGTPEVGVRNSYVTQSSNSKITWNPKTKRWEHASYSQVAPTINKLVRIVSSGQRGNRQSGGSY